MYIRKISKSVFSYRMSNIKAKIPSISEIKTEWNKFSDFYEKMDSTPQTFYFTLLQMLQIESAKNVLEVACGTGRMLPMMLNMKDPNTKYLATDISEKMVEKTRERLKHNLSLYHSKLTFEEWLGANNLYTGVANAEEPIAKPENVPAKFDRIICNLVLMLTENPQKMLKNLYNEAEDGCLMGVSIWGNKQNNNLMSSIREAYIQAGVELPKVRSNFHLYKKVPQLADKCGWQTVLNWQQNCPFGILQLNKEAQQFLFKHQVDKIEDQTLREKVKQILIQKFGKFLQPGGKGIHLSTQMLILRKKK